MYEHEPDGFIHGGTDSGPEPQYDFSSNANALGPNPPVFEAIKATNPTHYPDPHYSKLYQALAHYHQVDQNQIAVGAGTSDLIHRLVRWKATQGAMLVLSPTFSEYVRAAQVNDAMWFWDVNNADEYLARLPKARLAFLCVPNNPTGQVYSFIQEAAHIAHQKDVVLVCDLAYLPLLQETIELPQNVWKLYSPNKANGLTGIRAGYLVAPRDILRFRKLAPSWVLSVYGETFLKTNLSIQAQDWIDKSKKTLWQWRDDMAKELQDLGLEVTIGQANFLLAKVGEATRISKALREGGIRVRDCSSFGLSNWIRLSAQKPEACQALKTALQDLL